MNKTFKKSDINKYLGEKNVLKENELNELIGTNGALIDPNNNYKQSRNYIKSKKTTDDYVRNSTQGPEAYFIYGGPYYGINYSYVVNEEESILDNDSEEIYDKLDVVPSKKYSRDDNERKYRSAKKMADKDISSHYFKQSDPVYDHLPSDEWRNYKLPYDTKFDFDITENEDSMKSLVDEIIRNKKDTSRDFVKKMKESDIIVGMDKIADISELKDVHEKPMVIRKINSLLDLIHKENLKGDELAILLNHLIDNLDIYSMKEEHREIIGDKIKYGKQEGK
jgi:hypothetical protein